MHKHHLAPRYAGGTDIDWNLVELTVQEHYEAHLKRFFWFGDKRDYLAYRGLKGEIGKEEIIRELRSFGGKKSGGTKNWNEETYEKCRKAFADASALGNAKLTEMRANGDLDYVGQIISEKVTGENNGMHGKVWCVLKDAKNTKERKPFDKDSIPEDYIIIDEWRESRKQKTNSAYGKKWFNDTIIEILTYPDDPVIQGMQRGRLKKSKP